MIASVRTQAIPEGSVSWEATVIPEVVPDSRDSKATASLVANPEFDQLYFDITIPHRQSVVVVSENALICDPRGNPGLCSASVR